jgi:hypothetical protein
MTSDQPVGFGVVGVVNFADAVLQTLQAGSAASDRPLRVVAAVGHDPQRNAAPIEALRAKGIDVVTTLDELLSRQDIEAVWLPVPIHLHRPFTERALAAGKAVVCEKPVAGSIADLDAIKVYLANDLTPAGVKAIKPSFDKATADGAALKVKADAVNSQLVALRAAMSTSSIPAPAPAPAK